jgi:transposase-like protein
MYLLVLKRRRGGYIPFFVTERKRSEHALIEKVLEAYANGVSMGKIDYLARASFIVSLAYPLVRLVNSHHQR